MTSQSISPVDHPEPDSELPYVHELATLEQLRAVSDPLRLALFRLLREREHTVKELCDELGESSTRLYYHVNELERVGLVRLVRTENRSGTLHKYYRSVSQFLNVPTSLLHQDSSLPEVEAAVNWYTRMMEIGAMDVRQAFEQVGPDYDPDTHYVMRNHIRTTPEKAREFVRKIIALQDEMKAADDPQSSYRMTFTAALVPTPSYLPTPPRRSGPERAKISKRPSPMTSSLSDNDDGD